MQSEADDWQSAYRSRDASGAPDTAEAVGWAWIDQRARDAVKIHGEMNVLIESPPLPGEGRVIALYAHRQPIAVATIFRDEMNFAVLVRWAAKS